MFEGNDSPYNAISGVSNGVPGQHLAYGGRKWPFCWHRWHHDSKGAWAYRECKKCHRRKAWQGSLMGPVSLHWVLTGEEKEMLPPVPPSLVRVMPPPKPSDA